MRDPRKDAPTPPPPLDPQGSARRRLLLKAAAAGIPAVVTMLSGRRLAAGTFKNSCLRENPMKAGHGDRCKGTDLASDSFMRFPEATFPNGVGGTANVDLNSDGATDDFCILYVDDAGNIATINIGGAGNYGGAASPSDDPTAGYYAVTDSCWASFSSP